MGIKTVCFPFKIVCEVTTKNSSRDRPKAKTKTAERNIIMSKYFNSIFIQSSSGQLHLKSKSENYKLPYFSNSNS